MSVTTINYPEEAKRFVSAAIESGVFTIGDTTFPNDTTPNDFYVVWFAKTLQNWKALVSTDLVDGIYFEVTHNGIAGETYIDWYEKRENVVSVKTITTEDNG